ncbi:MAG TPA: hypothetical protein VJT49_05730 [Amycolatopsis sp.]|uniref:hypothetical protein n=1 Tax=Amycolatopsis sp. TaxID=37632 RepID=UPI002B4966BF|nr:hypothetical protein [Amycolatopsis sp.]HKS44606.1 hypothetical protein [Amycolatopsis sp.]
MDTGQLAQGDPRREPRAEQLDRPLPTFGALPRVHMCPFHETTEDVAHYVDAVDTGLREKIDVENEARAAMTDLYGP